MAEIWTPDELGRIHDADELEIATPRADGTLRDWVPIWAVCVGTHAYVRTWKRRDTGWYGQVVDSRKARIRVPGLERDVFVAAVGAIDIELRAGVDAAFPSKYGRYGRGTVERMTTEEAAATTLRLDPQPRDRTVDDP